VGQAMQAFLELLAIRFASNNAADLYQFLPFREMAQN
jgi:phosphodiesterase/alkaline phosphatase D-like protein